MERCICIHGHFYQPPRENPWLEAVERQDSAYPYHDWNERITAECYAPNGAVAHPRRRRSTSGRSSTTTPDQLQLRPDAALVAGRQRARDVRSAFLRPTSESQERFSGHGSAMAQAYNHMILPLANARDKRTQVLLGHPRFRAPLRTQAGRHVAAGDRGRPGDAGNAGRARHRVHDPGAAPGARECARSADELERRKRRTHRSHHAPIWPSCRPDAPSTSSSTTARSPAPWRLKSC